MPIASEENGRLYHCSMATPLKKASPVHETSDKKGTAQFKAHGKLVHTVHCITVRAAVHFTGYYLCIDFLKVHFSFTICKIFI